MSQPEMKIKLDADNCMDPFDVEVLPFDVHRFIWQHLNGADLLKISEVSRQWNEKVETSKGFIEKIKLSITHIPMHQGFRACETLPQHDVDVILQSKRNYANFEMKYLLLESYTLREMLLKKLAKSITNMTFDVVIGDTGVEFPNLKILRLGNGDGGYSSASGLQLSLQRMPKLETIYIDTLHAWELHVIKHSSMSLKEVRYKHRKSPYLEMCQIMLLNLSMNLHHFNENLQLIQEDIGDVNPLTPVPSPRSS